MAQKTQNEFRAHTERCGRLVHAGEQALHDDTQWNAARGMRLRIEEDFRVPHVVGCGAQKVRKRKLREVLFGLQNVAACIVDVQEILQT